MKPRSSGALLVTAALLCGCSVEIDGVKVEDPRPRRDGAALSAPESISIETPSPRVRSVMFAEVLSGRLVGWLGEVAGLVEVRDFESLVDVLAPGFQGHSPFRIAGDEAEPGAHRSSRLELSPARAPVLDRAGWIADLRGRLAPLRRIELCSLSLGDAEFRIPEGDSTWAAAGLGLHIVGTTQAGGREALHARLRARISLDDGVWTFDRIELVDGELRSVDRPRFENVSRAAGVHHLGSPFTERDGDGEAWNGLAVGDIDGDGRFDVFVPSAGRCFLYRNRGDGTFDEEAEARGLSGEADGTGALFFDFDGDGDQDLAVAHVGWVSDGQAPGGRPLCVYENDGEGHFTDATQALGLDVRAPLFSLVAFDADGDGWTDIFACGYGRMEVESNDSWVMARNGTPNVLLRNSGGRSFEDISDSAGIAGDRWSYAAAAHDFDGDGDQDLYVGNNFSPNRLWRNDGNAVFTDVAGEFGVDERGLTMGVSWADLDGDAEVDLFLTQPSSHAGHRLLDRIEGQAGSSTMGALQRMAAGNALFLRDEAGFVERSGGSGARHAGWAWGHACVDLDLDGALDVFCANGFVTGDLPEDT